MIPRTPLVPPGLPESTCASFGPSAPAGDDPGPPSPACHDQIHPWLPGRHMPCTWPRAPALAALSANRLSRASEAGQVQGQIPAMAASPSPPEYLWPLSDPSCRFRDGP
jgi:hypothetical protein